MPELPEVETTRRGISPHIEGRTITQVIIRFPELRWPIPKDLPRLLEGKIINSVQRRAKYLLLNVEGGAAIIHLGMSGNLRVIKADHPVAKHDHVDIRLDDGMALRLTDPRRFGALLWQGDDEQHSLLTKLGPEPLSDNFDGELLFRLSRKRQVAVKNFIMDNHIVVGVGNIYANEALFNAGIRPGKAAGKVSKASYELLAECIKAVLAKAIESGGTTLRDFLGGDGKPGYFKQELKVYGRGGEPCLVCGTTLKEIRLGQRASVYCSKCQK